MAADYAATTSNDSKMTAAPAEPKPWQRAVASSAGAILTALVTTPLDVVKTRLQAADSQALNAIQDLEASAATAVSNKPCTVPPSEPARLKAAASSSYTQALKLPRGYRCLHCGALLSPKHMCSAAATPSSAAAARSGQRPVRLGTISGLIQIARAEGVQGLYSGLSPTLVMAVPQTVLYFTCYDLFKAQLAAAGAGAVGAPMLAGGCARVLAASALAPLELVRTQMQGAAAADAGGLSAALRSVVARGGVASLWRGLVPTLWRDVPFSVMYWAGYDGIRRALAARPGGGGVQQLQLKEQGECTVFTHAFAAGAGAGAVATIITHPFDVSSKLWSLLVTAAIWCYMLVLALCSCLLKLRAIEVAYMR